MKRVEGKIYYTGSQLFIAQFVADVNSELGFCILNPVLSGGADFNQQKLS